MNGVELVPVPAGVVTLISPLEAPFGTDAANCESLTTVNSADVPLNETLVAPVKPEPPIVTLAPTWPLVGENDATIGAAGGTVTEKEPELEPVPPSVVTVMAPLDAPVGTVAVTCESLTTEKAADVPLKDTFVAPVKPEPPIDTLVPTGPLAGENDDTTGAEDGAENEKLLVLFPVPPEVVTLIRPELALAGTEAVMRESLLTEKFARPPLNETAVAPVKPEPLSVTLVPAPPLEGLKELILGAWVTIKGVLL